MYHPIGIACPNGGHDVMSDLSAGQIVNWAKQIGPGRVVAITTDNPTVMQKARRLAIASPELGHALSVRYI